MIEDLVILVILLVSFVIGQFIHIIKTNRLDTQRALKDWYRENKFSFWVQVIVGVGVLESLLNNISFPNTVSGWFVLIYTGLNCGIAGSSVGQTANRHIKSKINGGQ